MPYLKINYDDVNPTFEELDFPDDPKAWLHSCYEALGCSSIETVPTVISGLVLVIDEEGKLFDGWQNRINWVASMVYGSYVDVIVGDAIVARRDGINLVPLTSDDVSRLFKYF